MTGPCRDDVCITCADELTPVIVESLSEDGLTARGSIDGEPCEVALDLVSDARVGDVLLTHGGVALQLATPPSPPEADRRVSGEAGSAPIMGMDARSADA
ncbi:MAG: HypC/HybG/HupF family hydrogenase formation chaperone [Candidatus Dormibacteria bacterium]